MDMHLVPGTVSPRLDQLIRIEDTLGNSRADSPKAGVTISFASAPIVAGVDLNTTNGQVTAKAGAWPRTVVVTCTAREGAKTFTTSARVTVHQAFERIWLTPANFDAGGVATSGLTVRDGARNVRFSVLAKFTDGEIADLSNWSPRDVPGDTDLTYVHLEGSEDPAMVWRAIGAGMTADARTGVLSCTSAAANVTVTVAIEPLPPSPNRSASAPAVGAPPWSTAVELTLIRGPGFRKMADVRNVLILPDGFQEAQRAEFHALARESVNRLTTRRRTRPYDLLRDKFNYFTAWMESPDSDITVLNELQRSNVVGANADGMEFDPAAMPPIADRFLANERNTAFHTAMGLRPAADFFGTPRSVRFHAFRLQDTDFDAFLNALTDSAGAPVGSVWAQGGKDEALVAILCRSVRLGGSNNFRGTARHIAITLERRDRHRVTQNAAGNGYDLRTATIVAEKARMNCWTTIAHEVAHSFGLGDEYGAIRDVIPAHLNPEIDIRANLQRRDMLVTGGNLDADKIKWRWPRIELAGVLVATPAAVGTRFVCPLQPGHAAAFDRKLKEKKDLIVRLRPTTLSGLLRITAVAGNDVEIELEPGSSNLVPDTFPAGSFLTLSGPDGGYSVNKVAVLTGPPAPVGPRFRCTLQAGQATPFAVGKFVLLRTRDLLTAPTVSDRLKVMAVRPRINEVEVELLPGSAPLVPANFSPGSVLMAPKRAAAVAPALGADLELVHGNIRARINAKRNPLNAADGDPANRVCVNGSVGTPTGATNFPGGVAGAPRPPRFSSWIVGLFESGRDYRCGVYHPTGICTMRSLTFSDAAAGGATAAYQFCPVCRYAMVDLIDPSKHGAIDQDYDPRFPV
jgi:hypothetical protein